MTTQPADEATTDLAAPTADAGAVEQAGVCGAPAQGGPCALPRGHNVGHADVPEAHRAGVHLTDADVIYDFLVSEGYHAYYPAAEKQAEKLAALLDTARASTAQDEGAGEVERLTQAWDDGYNDAVTMARCYGHTDHWENEPTNPHRAVVDRAKGGA